MSGRLRQALEEVARRFRRVRLWGGLAACWLVLALAGCAIAASAPLPGTSRDPRGLAAGGAGAPGRGRRHRLRAGGACDRPAIPAGSPAGSRPGIPSWAPSCWPRSTRSRPRPGGRLGFLQATVVREALEHRRAHDWDETVPTWLLRSAKLAHAASLAFLVWRDRRASRSRCARRPTAARTRAGGRTPPRSRSIPATSSSSAAARCWSSPASTRRTARRQPRRRRRRPGPRPPRHDPQPRGPHLRRPGRIGAIRPRLPRRVRRPQHGQLPRPRLRVSRAEACRRPPRLPRLHRAGAEGRRGHPARHGRRGDRADPASAGSTRTSPRRRSSTRRARPSRSSRDESQPHTYRAQMTLDDPRRFKVKLVDAEGRTNPVEPEIVVNVTRNRPPTVTITQPSHDVEVSPLEEVKLKARMDDDFGLVRHGLSYAIGGEEPKEIVFASPKRRGGLGPGEAPAPARGRAHARLRGDEGRARSARLVLLLGRGHRPGRQRPPRLERHVLRRGPPLRARSSARASSRRPAPPRTEGQEGGNAQEAGQLAELQKQIINATWKLIRRETRSKPTGRVRRGHQDPPRVAEGRARAGGPARGAAPRRSRRRPRSSRP